MYIYMIYMYIYICIYICIYIYVYTDSAALLRVHSSESSWIFAPEMAPLKHRLRFGKGAKSL